MATTNKRYSYPRVTAIRIDVHPAGETPINTPHAFHAWFTYGLEPYPVVHVGNLSLVPTRLKHAPAPGRSLGNRRQTSPAITLGHLIFRPSWQPWSRGERFRSSGYIATSVYWAHITSMWSINSILARGANPSVLNRHWWGLQPWRCRLSTHHSPTFPTDGPLLST
jgi:hypothetical protein